MRLGALFLNGQDLDLDLPSRQLDPDRIPDLPAEKRSGYRADGHPNLRSLRSQRPWSVCERKGDF